MLFSKVKPPGSASAWLKEHTQFFRALVLHRIVQAAVAVHKDRRLPQLDMFVPLVTNRAMPQAQHGVHVRTELLIFSCEILDQRSDGKH